MTYMPGPSARTGQAAGRSKKIDPALFQRVDERRAREEALRYKGYCPPPRQRLVVHGGMKFFMAIGALVAFVGFIYLGVYDFQAKPQSVLEYNKAVEAWSSNAGRFAAMGPFTLTIDKTVSLPRLPGNPDERAVDTDSTNFGVEDYEDKGPDGVGFAATDSPFNRTLITLPLRSALNKTVTLRKLDGTVVFSQWILFSGFHSYGTTYQAGCTKNGGTYSGSQCFFYFTPKASSSAVCLAVDLDAPPGQQYGGGCAFLEPEIGFSRTIQNDDEEGNQVIRGNENRNSPVAMSGAATFTAGVIWDSSFRVMVRAKQDPYVAAAIYTNGFMSFPRKNPEYYQMAVPDIVAGFIMMAPFLITYGWAAYHSYQDTFNSEADPDFDPRALENAEADAEAEAKRKEESEKGVKDLEKAMGAPPPSTNPKVLKMRAEALEREKEAKRMRKLRKKGLLPPGAIVPVDSNGNVVGSPAPTATLGSPSPTIRKVYTKPSKKKGGGSPGAGGDEENNSPESPTSPLTPPESHPYGGGAGEGIHQHAANPPIVVSPMPSRKLDLDATAGSTAIANAGAAASSPLSLVGSPTRGDPDDETGGNGNGNGNGGNASARSPSKFKFPFFGSSPSKGKNGGGAVTAAALTGASATTDNAAAAATATAAAAGPVNTEGEAIRQEAGPPPNLAIAIPTNGNNSTDVAAAAAAGVDGSAAVAVSVANDPSSSSSLAALSQPYYGPEGGYASQYNAYDDYDDDDDNWSTDSEDRAERERIRIQAELEAKAKEVKFDDLPWQQRFSVFFKFHLEATLRLLMRGFFYCKWPCLENFRFMPNLGDDDEDFDDEETRQQKAEEAARKARGELDPEELKKAQAERERDKAAAAMRKAAGTGKNPYQDDEPFKPIPAKLKRRPEVLKKKEGGEEEAKPKEEEEPGKKSREPPKSKFFIPVYETLEKKR